MSTNLGNDFYKFLRKEYLRLSDTRILQVPKGYMFIGQRYIDLKRSKNFWGTDTYLLTLDIISEVEVFQKEDGNEVGILTGRFRLPEGNYWKKFNKTGKIGLQESLTLEEVLEWRQYREEKTIVSFNIVMLSDDLDFTHIMLEQFFHKKLMIRDLVRIEIISIRVNCPEEAYYRFIFKKGKIFEIRAARLKEIAEEMGYYQIQKSKFWVFNIMKLPTKK